MPGLGLIAVAGIIGVGKTTLARRLARTLGAHLVLEEYDRNPFLALQLGGDRQAALPSELCFLLSRARQLEKRTLAPFGTVVCDYVFDKNRLFARLNLDERELAIYDEVEGPVRDLVASPQAVVYLHDEIERCLDRIRQRGRTFEQSISAGYLRRLADHYEGLLAKYPPGMVLRLDCSKHDCRQTETAEHVAEVLGRRLGALQKANAVAPS